MNRTILAVLSLIIALLLAPICVYIYNNITNRETMEFKRFSEKHLIKKPTWVKDGFSITSIDIPGGKPIRLFEGKLESDNPIISIRTTDTFSSFSETLETIIPGVVFATSCEGVMCEVYIKSSFQFTDVDLVDRATIIQEIIYREAERQGLDRFFSEGGIYFDSRALSRYPAALNIFPALTLADFKGKCVEFSILPGYQHCFGEDGGLTIFLGSETPITGKWELVDFKWLKMDTGGADVLVFLISGEDLYLWGSKIVTKTDSRFGTYSPVLVHTQQDEKDDAALDYTVFVNATDKTYHKADCLHLHNRNAPFTLSEVIKNGMYIPCKVCKPNRVSGGHDYVDNMKDYIKMERPGSKVSGHPPHIMYDNSWRQLVR